MKRILELDFIKAFAIVLMVYTHTAIFFYDYTNQFFSTISDIGGYISLTLFLFISGATLPILMKKYKPSELLLRLLKRAITFFVLYILISLFITNGQHLGDILLLRYMPVLADFIFAFSLFFLLGIVLIYLLPKMKPEYLLLLFLAIYIVGYILYHQTGSPDLVPVKSILVGHGDLHRFPLMQYGIVYVLGVVYTINKKWFTEIRLTTLFIILAPLAMIMIHFTGLERWVASPGFMLYGVVAVILLLLIYKPITSVLTNVQELYNSLSLRVSGILVAHILVTVGLSKFVMERYGAVELIILSFVILVISWWLGKWIKL